MLKKIGLVVLLALCSYVSAYAEMADNDDHYRISMSDPDAHARAENTVQMMQDRFDIATIFPAEGDGKPSETFPKKGTDIKDSETILYS